MDFFESISAELHQVHLQSASPPSFQSQMNTLCSPQSSWDVRGQVNHFWNFQCTPLDGMASMIHGPKEMGNHLQTHAFFGALRDLKKIQGAFSISKAATIRFFYVLALAHHNWVGTHFFNRWSWARNTANKKKKTFKNLGSSVAGLVDRQKILKNLRPAGQHLSSCFFDGS